MEFNELKKLINLTGGKYVFLENNEPSFVLMSFDEYKKLVENLALNQAKETPDFYKKFDNETALQPAKSVANLPDLNKKNVEDLPIL